MLRHLGINYADFVRQTNEGVTGLDVELMELFARHLGVRYESVPTTWSRAFGDLTGKQVRQQGDRTNIAVSVDGGSGCQKLSGAPE